MCCLFSNRQHKLVLFESITSLQHQQCCQILQLHACMVKKFPLTQGSVNFFAWRTGLSRKIFHKPALKININIQQSNFCFSSYYNSDCNENHEPVLQQPYFPILERWDSTIPATCPLTFFDVVGPSSSTSDF